MSLIQWKQIDTRLYDDARLTGSLYLSGTFFLNDVDILQQVGTSGIFRQTGSFWATTNDLQVTGSFKVQLQQSDTFEITSGSQQMLEVNEEGVLVLGAFSNTPTPVSGGLIYSSSNEFYVGM